MAYFAQPQATDGGYTVFARVNPANVAGILPGIHRAVVALAPHLASEMPRSLEATRAGQVAPFRWLMIVVILLGLIAATLASSGLYGLLAYMGEQRRQEMGVRIALGARPGDIAWLMLGGGLRLVGVGLVVGAILGLATLKLLEAMVLQAAGMDPAMVALPMILVGVMGMLACWWPARTASHTDPGIILRQT